MQRDAFGLGWASTFNHTLEDDGDPATIEVKAVSILFHWLSGKVPQAL